MQDLKERTAYLRGLVEGAAFPSDEKEKLVWDGLMNFCEEVADELTQMTDSQEEFEDYVEAIDEDLGTLEKYFYDDGEADDNVDVIFSKDEKGEGVMELSCPHCHEEIYFEDQNGDYEVICPECGKVVWNSAGLSNASAANIDVI
ncbi:MAG TPA: hypothetical protein DDW65_21985 [Firmicutes bacterium]|jgi:DNA-directed RNA polymerase subunit delta|nr:hypothetical protein [Bacillota bacterium]